MRRGAGNEQLESGVLSVFVPVRSKDGDVLAVINCSGELKAYGHDGRGRVAGAARRGHRLVLELGSDPALLAPRKQERFVYFGSAGTPYPALNTVHHGRPAASALVLTVRLHELWDTESRRRDRAAS